MRILLVSAMFPPIRTGTSFFSRNLANSLHAKGHDVTVITVQSGGNGDSEASREQPPYAVHRLPALHIATIPFFKHFRVSALWPGNYRRVSRIARAARTECVLLVNHYLDIAFLAIHAARAVRAPLACSIGTQLQSSTYLGSGLLNFFDRAICGALIFPHCDRLVAWDREIARYLSDVHGKSILQKSTIINFGVNGDPAVFLRHQHDYGLHNQILAIGSVIRQRNYIPLIRAFSILASEFPQLRLKVVGHVYVDEPMDLARSLGIANRITFTGELVHDEVLEEVKRSDLYFVSLTARYLGLGTATLESMLMGVPTVANAYADMLGKARLEDMEHIVLLKDLAPAHIADRMRALLGSQTLRARIGQGGRAFVSEHMNWDRVAGDYLDMLCALSADK